MEYTREDAARFLPEPPPKQSWVEGRLAFALAIVLTLGLVYAVALLVLSLDKRVPLPVAMMPEAHPQYPLSHPLGSTWIQQSGNDARGKQMKPQRRHTTVADLEQRK